METKCNEVEVEVEIEKRLKELNSLLEKKEKEKLSENEQKRLNELTGWWSIFNN